MTRHAFDLLLDAALATQKNAYCPYSRFAVGAAVMTADGSIYSGCNVENASFGSSLCAERSAVAAAVSAGHRRMSKVLVVAPFARPCGACRQVLYEFSDKTTQIMLVSQKPKRKATLTTVWKLLPDAFNSRTAGLL